jgi:ABC-type phosphate transport system substrate-binding protein
MKTRTILSAVTLLVLSSFAHADVAVIVNPSNASALDDDAIKWLFLGKAKSFPNGEQAIPLNQKQGSTVSDEFGDKVLGKSASQLKAYWSKLVFTGKGTPPKEQDNDAEVIKLVASNPNLIGFIDAKSVNDSIKVIKTY